MSNDVLLDPFLVFFIGLFLLFHDYFFIFNLLLTALEPIHLIQQYLHLFHIDTQLVRILLVIERNLFFILFSGVFEFTLMCHL